MGIERHIATFLLKNRSCTLPGIGRLYYNIDEPVYDQADQVMHPPVASVSFAEEGSYSPAFENYISEREQIPVSAAGQAYQQFTDQLYRLKYGSELIVPSLGSFYADEQGKLQFQGFSFPHLKPVVPAVRVVHPEASHAILVGDRESDSVEMTEFYHQEEDTGKRKWWIAAIVLFVIASAAILIHYSTNEGFGNSRKITPSPEPETYTIPGR